MALSLPGTHNLGYRIEPPPPTHPNNLDVANIDDNPAATMMMEEQEPEEEEEEEEDVATAAAGLVQAALRIAAPQVVLPGDVSEMPEHLSRVKLGK